MITDSGKVLYTSTSDKYYRVFLQVVAFARDIRAYFNTVGETYTSYLSQSRVWLFRSHRGNLCADAPLLRSTFRNLNLSSL
jgi:hypothetical protein